MMVLLVNLKVCGKVVNSCGKKSYLNLCGTGVLCVLAELAYDLGYCNSALKRIAVILPSMRKKCSAMVWHDYDQCDL